MHNSRRGTKHHLKLREFNANLLAFCTNKRSAEWRIKELSYLMLLLLNCLGIIASEVKFLGKKFEQKL
jgi:hypothetical protein